MFPFRRADWLSLFCALTAVLMAGCNPNLEKNEQFQTEKSRVDRVDEDVRNVLAKLTLLENEQRQLTKDVAALKNGGAAAATAASANALKAIEQRLIMLETATKNAEMARATSAKVPAPAAAESAAGPAEAKSLKTVGNTAKGSATELKVKTSTAKSSKAVAVVTPKATARTRRATGRRSMSVSKARVQASPAAGGVYYQVVKDDTLSSIAERYKISTGDLLKANNMSSNASLFIGQNLWIPKK